jgi:hypothetical protein
MTIISLHSFIFCIICCVVVWPVNGILFTEVKLVITINFHADLGKYQLVSLQSANEVC